MSDILARIIDHKRTLVVPRLPPVDRAAMRDLPVTRGFRAALRRPADDTIHVIAECKKGSPSKGIFVENYDPVLTAYHYQLGGAHALSVLTDEPHFFGHLDHLKRVHNEVSLPAIRKDFIIDERQIAEARLAGADAILLIVACLSRSQLTDLQGFAWDVGLDVLVEVHDEGEAADAIRAEANLVGVNNRNLKDFSISLQTTYDLLPGLLGSNRVVVSESGISSRADCQRLEEAGVDAVLVGEALITDVDPAARLAALRGKLVSRL